MESPRHLLQFKQVVRKDENVPISLRCYVTLNPGIYGVQGRDHNTVFW